MFIKSTFWIQFSIPGPQNNGRCLRIFKFSFLNKSIVVDVLIVLIDFWHFDCPDSKKEEERNLILFWLNSKSIGYSSSNFSIVAHHSGLIDLQFVTHFIKYKRLLLKVSYCLMQNNQILVDLNGWSWTMQFDTIKSIASKYILSALIYYIIHNRLFESDLVLS